MCLHFPRGIAIALPRRLPILCGCPTRRESTFSERQGGGKQVPGLTHLGTPSIGGSGVLRGERPHGPEFCLTNSDHPAEASGLPGVRDPSRSPKGTVRSTYATLKFQRPDASLGSSSEINFLIFRVARGPLKKFRFLAGPRAAVFSQPRILSRYDAGPCT